MTKREKLVEHQSRIIIALEDELSEAIRDGNEYYANQLKDEILVAKSLARLLHKDTWKIKGE